MTQINTPQSSDEMPPGMTFTRTPVQDPFRLMDECTACGNKLQYIQTYPATCGMCKTWKGTRNDNHGRVTEFQEDFAKTNPK